MEYSVGSLSDLITGSNTPNKKKVVKKQIVSQVTTTLPGSNTPNKKMVVKKQAKVTTTDPGSNGFEEYLNIAKTPEGKTPKLSRKKRKLSSNEGEEILPTLKQKVKKSVATEDEVETEMSPPKKSKNAKNAERRLSTIEKPSKEEEDPELLARTVFVGNLPITSDTHKLKKLFNQFGKVDSVRIRGVPVANPKTSKKVAFIKKEFHPQRKSFYGFVRFEERESALKAVEANGMLYKENHLRIHLCDAKAKPDESKAIFVGNLSFYAEENDLWTTFESCGPISSVRIVRDSRTGMGKGFGYVNFENSDSVTLALEMENVKLKDRELRISICNLNAAKKDGKNKKPKQKSVKPKKRDSHVVESDEVDNKEEKKVTDTSYQGIKFIAKKKKKLNKGLLQMKRKVKQIAPK